MGNQMENSMAERFENSAGADKTSNDKNDDMNIQLDGLLRCGKCEFVTTYSPRLKGHELVEHRARVKSVIVKTPTMGEAEGQPEKKKKKNETMQEDIKKEVEEWILEACRGDPRIAGKRPWVREASQERDLGKDGQEGR